MHTHNQTNNKKQKKNTSKGRTKLVKPTRINKEKLLALKKYVAVQYKNQSFEHWEYQTEAKEVKKTYTNKAGDVVQVVKYDRGSKQRLVRFADGVEAVFSLTQLTAGKFTHPNQPTVNGKGYLGTTTVYSAAGAQRWQNLMHLGGTCTSKAANPRKPTNAVWHSRAAFLEWFCPRHAQALELFPHVEWQLESDLSSFVTGKPAEYGPASTYLVPRSINNALTGLVVLGKQIEALLTGETAKPPKGISYDKTRNMLILTLDGHRWGSFKNDAEGLLQALELLTRLKLYKVVTDAQEFEEALDPQLFHDLRSIYPKLFGGLVTE